MAIYELEQRIFFDAAIAAQTAEIIVAEMQIAEGSESVTEGDEFSQIILDSGFGETALPHEESSYQLGDISAEMQSYIDNLTGHYDPVTDGENILDTPTNGDLQSTSLEGNGQQATGSSYELPISNYELSTQNLTLNTENLSPDLSTALASNDYVTLADDFSEYVSILDSNISVESTDYDYEENYADSEMSISGVTTDTENLMPVNENLTLPTSIYPPADSELSTSLEGNGQQATVRILKT